MKTYFAAYIAAAAVFLALDAIWLGYVARDFYRDQLGDLLSPQPRLGVAALFYLLYVAGVVYFAITPGLQAGSWTTALVSGALFGLVAYATYDLTNLATLKGWPAALSVVDTIWGAALTSVAATAGYFAGRAVG